jgi:hypothetical protein
VRVEGERDATEWVRDEQPNHAAVQGWKGALQRKGALLYDYVHRPAREGGSVCTNRRDEVSYADDIVGQLNARTFSAGERAQAAERQDRQPRTGREGLGRTGHRARSITGRTYPFLGMISYTVSPRFVTARDGAGASSMPVGRPESETWGSQIRNTCP